MTQRTDRELLELAAKAAELNVKAIQVDCDDNFGGLIVGRKNTRDKTLWNPLKNDGDALRLAVKLDMNVDIGYWVRVDCGDLFASEKADSDPYSATRRAIVRAAAEIGAKS